MRFDEERSTIDVRASSTIHPIHTTAAVTGWLDAVVSADGATVDPRHPITGEVHFDLGGMRSGNPLIDREAERRLQIRRYPTVSGVLTNIDATDDPQVFTAEGALTFHGVTREIHGTLRIEGRDGVLGITGVTTIDVTDFGVQPPSLVLVKVHKDVTIELAAFTAPEP